MSHIAYVNGRYVPHAAAAIHVEDRGYQFADGVYEVCGVRDGQLVDEARHMARLKRSLGELKINWPMAPRALGVVMREVVRRNGLRDGYIYMQVTRGVARRDHAFPSSNTPASIVMTARAVDLEASEKRAQSGVAVITVPDNRWQRVDIKSVSLLPNVLAKQAARDAGAFEAWFVDGEGQVTEGSSSNAWIVTADGAIVTHPADGTILHGITRTVVAEVAARAHLRLEERAFTVEEALEAREAFMTSATAAVTPIVKIDNRSIGSGQPGPVATALRQERLKAARLAPR